MLQRLFNHRVPGPFDHEPRGVRELGARPLHISRVLREGEEGVKCCRGFRGPRQRINIRAAGLDQPLVEASLERERPVFGGERLVFKRLEFRRNKALGVLQCLTSAVVIRHLIGLSPGDLDVVAGDTVIFHPECRDAGPLFFPRFDLREHIAGIVPEFPEFFQLVTEAIRDHASIPERNGGKFKKRSPEEIGKRGIGFQDCRGVGDKRNP